MSTRNASECFPESPRKRAKRVGDSGSQPVQGTNLKNLVAVGDAYFDLDSERGLRALWKLALPNDAVEWLALQTGLQEAAFAFADIWWNYIETLLGGAASAFASAEHAKLGSSATDKPQAALSSTFLVELAVHNMKSLPEMRGRFLALLFQVVVSNRHDQSASYILGDPAQPFAHYVSRSKIGALFSLRALLKLEDEYLPAARAVGLYRKSSGKNPVAHQRTADNLQMCVPLRKRMFLYRCKRCLQRKNRAKPGCKKCSRLKEGDPAELVRVWGSQHTYEPKPDTWTVLCDVERKHVLDVQRGDVISTHCASGWEGWQAQSRPYADGQGKISVVVRRKGVNRYFEYEPDVWVNTIVESQTKQKGTLRMLREHPELLHKATLSVHLDNHLQRRVSGGSVVRYASKPVYVQTKSDGSPLDHSELKRYLIWRCAVGLVLAIEPGLEAQLAKTSCCRLVSAQVAPPSPELSSIV